MVPPRYVSWGAPPPGWYIDDLMRHEGRPYYVGLLKAAELHGATHHAVMEFPVVTDKRLPGINAGRTRIAFHYRKDMKAVSDGVENRKTDTGTMRVSSVELTALDLVRYSHASGGIDNLVTVLADLGPTLGSQELARLSSAAERSVVQRLGYLLDRLGHGNRTGLMYDALSGRGAFPWVELDRKETRDPEFTPPPLERDEHWRVIVRRPPEVDE